MTECEWLVGLVVDYVDMCRLGEVIDFATFCVGYDTYEAWHMVRTDNPAVEALPLAS
jgi:hypothetical protein